MRAEKEAIVSLMKKAQTERFKDNKISGLVYNIQMKKYEERSQAIREELPVLEDRLRVLSTARAVNKDKIIERTKKKTKQKAKKVSRGRIVKRRK